MKPGRREPAPVPEAVVKLRDLFASDPAGHSERLESLDLEALGDHWGHLCCTREIAREWADRLTPELAAAWRENRYFRGTTACLSSLLACGQHDRLLDLLGIPTRPQVWEWRRYGVAAFQQLGRLEDALRLAEQRCVNECQVSVSLACEQLLFQLGRSEEAYRHYGLKMPPSKASFADLCQRYPRKTGQEILRDLVDTSEESSDWFLVAVKLGEGEAVAPLVRNPNWEAQAHLRRRTAPQAPPDRPERGTQFRLS